MCVCNNVWNISSNINIINEMIILLMIINVLIWY